MVVVEHYFFQVRYDWEHACNCLCFVLRDCVVQKFKLSTLNILHKGERSTVKFMTVMFKGNLPMVITREKPLMEPFFFELLLNVLPYFKDA